jgi:hypothetical protein
MDPLAVPENPIKRKTLSAVVFAIAWGASLWAILPLNLRWREEAHDRRVALAIEWNEVRDFNARLGQSDDQLLQDFRTRGVNAVVIAPVTLAELVKQRRVQAASPVFASDPLDVTRLRVDDAALARQLFAQWTWRAVSGLRLRAEGKTHILERSGGFAALKDTDVGFDPVFMQRVRTSGLTPILRLLNDPWLEDAHFFDWLNALPNNFVHMGVLFSSEELPGGRVKSRIWRSWISRQGWVQFLPEFRPAPAAAQMARALPSHAFRTHSIPAAEQKDLNPDQQRARWSRAVEERSCRLLLARMGLNDSRESFFAAISNLDDLLKRGHWQRVLPQPRNTWRSIGLLETQGRLLIAFGVVCITPFFALAFARRREWIFAWVVGLSLIGALIAAAIADTPYTRIQVMPFRGVKVAFLFSWLLAAVTLYPLHELRAQLSQVVRRRDVVIGAVAFAVFAYLLLRSGNAPAAWKPSWEQSLRNGLEALLVARPRFKEFAIGFPALWIGCWLAGLYRQRKSTWDGRALIAIGMIGPISMINTFCHLHSPLWLEVLRSFNGVAIGIFLGWLATLPMKAVIREGS